MSGSQAPQRLVRSRGTRTPCLVEPAAVDTLQLTAGQSSVAGAMITFLDTNAAPSEELMVFIDEHRERFGVEPICRTLQIAPSTYWARKAAPAPAGLADVVR